jgi:nitrile hydratase beta subunit
MNGVHDMGGMTDFGPVIREANEPVFHADWERQVFGMVRNVIDKRYNWDEFRSAIERLAPIVYLSSSYYERWLAALERYLIEKGVVSEQELRARTEGSAPESGLPPFDMSAFWADQAETHQTPAFKSGDAVKVRTVNPMGHTRLPRYVRGKQGLVDRNLGQFIFPDRNSLGGGEHREPVYAVRFQARELWGEEAGAHDSVCVDLWHSYLQPADDHQENGKR